MGQIRTLRDQTGRNRARRLRADQTSAEECLWAILRNRGLGGWKWRRQVVVAPFIVDFLCVEAALVIELDGGVHETQQDYDARRTHYLQRQGFRVIRFSNEALRDDRHALCEAILAALGGPCQTAGDEVNAEPPLTQPSPHPLRVGGEGF